MGRLEGKVALVTGAASGNGRAMAIRFAAEGADVVIGDVQADALGATAAAIKEQGRRVVAQACDVTRKDDVDRLVAVAETLGGLDIAVANAGVSDGPDADCFTITEERWSRTIDVNLKGVFFTLQAAANAMRAQGRGGRLIAISSIMGEWGGAGSPAYCASKGGVKQLMKSFAIACGPYGITCNAIGPGFIHTNMTARLDEATEFREFLEDRTPVGYIGDPEDVAAVAVFIASDEARYLNGTTIFPDGGITAGNYSNRLRRLGEAATAAARRA
jgi:glucose 1-dehydrogenase